MAMNPKKPMFTFKIPFIVCSIIFVLLVILFIHQNTSPTFQGMDKHLDLTARRTQKRSTLDKSEILARIKPPDWHKRKLSARETKLTPQANTVLKHRPQGKYSGIFVEVGAYDGETSSNTLALELYYNWTGLLIEADPDYYTQLLAKHRSAHSLHACLSDSNTTHMMYFNNAGGQLGAVIPRSRAGRISETKNIDNPIQEILCLPLGDILTSMNLTHIDYLSLDVEGLEYDVLSSIPYDSLQIDYISVEYLHVRQGLEALRDLMTSYGYRLLDKLYHIDDCRETFVHDFVFVKEE